MNRELLPRWIRRLALFLRRGAAERSMDAELRHHIECEIADRVRQGMAPEEARRIALRDFGSIDAVKEYGRDARGVRPLEDFVFDLPYAMRTLRRTPWFTAAAVLTFALGIGASSAILGVVYGILMRPLPYAHADRLVALWERNLPRNRDQNVVSVDNFEAWRDSARAFDAIAALVPRPVTLVEGATPERIIGAEVSPGYFDLLGVAPAHGREFGAADARPGAAGVVILSDGFWRRRLGGDPGVVGRALSVGGQPHTIVGVMPNVEPPRFGWLGEQQPLAAGDLPPVADVRFADAGFFRTLRIGTTRGAVFGDENLAGDVRTPARPGAYLSALRHPDAQRDIVVRASVPPDLLVSSLRAAVSALEPSLPLYQVASMSQIVDTSLAGDRFTTALLAAFAIVALLLAAVGIFGVFSADVAHRRREIGVRLALGAGSWRVVAMVLRRALTRAAVGVVAGAALALLLARSMASLLFGVRPTDPLSLAMVAALLLAVAAGATLVPALRALRSSPLDVLRSE